MNDDNGLEAARSRFEKIARLVLALQSADVFAREYAQEHIQQDALEVMIPCSWHAPGKKSVDLPIEYCVLLSRDGAAVRIVGDQTNPASPSVRGSNIRIGLTPS